MFHDRIVHDNSQRPRGHGGAAPGRVPVVRVQVVAGPSYSEQLPALLELTEAAFVQALRIVHARTKSSS